MTVVARLLHVLRKGPRRRKLQAWAGIVLICMELVWLVFNLWRFLLLFGGLVLGVASAYFGGKFDLIVQRIMDVIMAFPLIILALAVVATLGTGIQNVIIAITIPFIPQCARVVRSSALSPRTSSSPTRRGIRRKTSSVDAPSSRERWTSACRNR